MQSRTKKLLLAIPAVIILPVAFYALWLWITAPTPKVVELGSDFKVSTYQYRHEKTPERSIIILPPTGGMNILDNLYAHALWKAGCDVYILTFWSGQGEIAYDLNLHQRFYTDSRNAVGLILDEIKSPFIGILGTSVGGLHAAVSVGTHDRLNSALVITAGAPIPEVVIDSDQVAMQFLKKKRYEMYKFQNDAEYLVRLNEAFTIDPFELPRKFEGKKMGVVIAEHDLTVPTANQVKLKELWNATEVVKHSDDHFYGIVKTAIFNRGKIVEFFTTP